MSSIQPFAWVFLVVTVGMTTEQLGAMDGAEGDDLRATINGSSWNWAAEGWKLTTRYEKLIGYAPRPNEQTTKAVSVEWLPPEVDDLGTFCTIRGRLVIPDQDNQGKLAVNWFQGVTLYIGMEPNAKPNWSAGMNQKDTLSDTAIVTPSGECRFKVDMRGTNYDRSRPGAFQVGLALARHVDAGKDTQDVEWDSKTAAIPATVKMLVVPAAPELTHELDLINRASRWPFSNPDSVALIRAVNALQRVGKDRALSILERYVELTSGFEYFEEQEIVFWIVRVLFEPIRMDERIPPPLIAVDLAEGGEPADSNWPLNPMAVVGDMPFMVGRRIAMGGQPEHPSSHLAWARRHCVIRDALLAPTGNPFQAAESLLNSSQFQQLDEFERTEAKRLIMEQACAMLPGIVDPIPRWSTKLQRQWDSRRRKAQAKVIRWDAKLEAFVGGTE